MSEASSTITSEEFASGSGSASGWAWAFVVLGLMLAAVAAIAGVAWSTARSKQRRGATGRTGSQGATGAGGANGLDGSTGADGVPGSTGAAGLPGSTGAAGAAGSTGAAGPTGGGGGGGAGWIYITTDGTTVNVPDPAAYGPPILYWTEAANTVFVLPTNSPVGQEYVFYSNNAAGPTIYPPISGRITGGLRSQPGNNLNASYLGGLEFDNGNNLQPAVGGTLGIYVTLERGPDPSNPPGWYLGSNFGFGYVGV